MKHAVKRSTSFDTTNLSETRTGCQWRAQSAVRSESRDARRVDGGDFVRHQQRRRTRLKMCGARNELLADYSATIGPEQVVL